MRKRDGIHHQSLSKNTEGANDALAAKMPKSKKKRKGYRKPPASLPFAAIVAILMSAMYFYKVFAYIPRAIEEDNIQQLSVAFMFMLLFFAMFVRFLIALFRLPSGSRKAWATTVRMAGSYIIFSILGWLGLGMLSTDVNFGIFMIPAWIMCAVMLALIAYMFVPNIRDFFTPTYADKVKLSGWILYVFWIDPFAGKKLIV